MSIYFGGQVTAQYTPYSTPDFTPGPIPNGNGPFPNGPAERIGTGICSGLTGRALSICEMGVSGITGVVESARICPPGTACSGPSINLGSGVSGCLGSCRQIEMEQIPFEPAPPECPPGSLPRIENGQLVCEPFEGSEFNGGGAPPMAANGCGCPGKVGAPKSCRCCLPGGGQGSTNKSGYYTYGRCGDPRRPTYHAPGTKCVKGRRSINPTNIKAGRRAVTRVNAVHRELLKVENAMAKFAKTPQRRKK